MIIMSETHYLRLLEHVCQIMGACEFLPIVLLFSNLDQTVNEANFQQKQLKLSHFIRESSEGYLNSFFALTEPRKCHAIKKQPVMDE